MRGLASIRADIIETLARLDDLRAEEKAARQAEIDAVIRLFDAGLSFRQIGRQCGQTSAAVQGIVFRSGRTVEGRDAIRNQIDKAVVGAPAAAAPEAGLRLPQDGPASALINSTHLQLPATGDEIRAHAAR